MREQDHIANGRRVGQQHHQTVDADAATARRRQAVLHRADVVGVVVHRLIIARIFLGDLRLKARGLVFRIVQLGVAVGVLAADDEQLETLGQARLGVGAARQRGHFHRVVDDEGRVPQQRLGAFFEQRQLQAAQARGRGQLAAQALDLAGHPGGVGQLRVGVLRVVVLDRFHDGEAVERLAQVHFLALVGHGGGAAGNQRAFADDGFGHLHHALVVAIRFVELDHGELGVVARAHPLVAEVAVDLEHAFQAAHHQALQVQLRGDAQVERHVQGVVVGDERLGRRAARNRVHHRGFHFQVAFTHHHVAHFLHDLGALDEGFAAFLAHDEVGVALAVLGFLVGDAVEFFRQRTDVLGQHAHFGRLHRQFAGLGLEQHALDGDDVAQVPALEVGVDVFAHVVAGDEGLDAAAAVLQGGEAGFAHHTFKHHAAGDGDFDFFGFQRFRFFGGVVVLQRFGEVAAFEVVGVGDAFFADRFQFQAAFRHDLVFVLALRLCLFVIRHDDSVPGRVPSAIN